MPNFGIASSSLCNSGGRGPQGPAGPAGTDGEGIEDTMIICPGTGNIFFPNTDIGLFGSRDLVAQDNGITPNTQFDIDEDTMTIGTGNIFFPNTDIGLFGSRGLEAQNNGTTPNTQFDIDADSVTLWETGKFQTITLNNVSSITNNVSTAGPVANGRDQAGAFSASSWIHFYWIWNGTTLATVSSTVAPPTGPTLPTGYTHWSYVGAVRFNASSAMLRTYIRGNTEYYEEESLGTTNLVSNGTATTFTNLSATAFIPPNAISGLILAHLSLIHTSSLPFITFVRPGGTTFLATGIRVSEARPHASGVVNRSDNHFPMFFVNNNISIDYRISLAPATSGGVFLDVHGFVMPNGAV